MNNNLNEIADKFISTRRYDKAELTKKIQILLKVYYGNNGSYTFDAEVFAESVRDAVKGYTSNKDTLINVYKEFCEHLKSQYDLQFKIDFPPIPISNTFERLMFIAKYLHDTDSKISDLEDILWQSSRTIEDDLKKLRGNDDDPLQVCGKKFVIDGIERERGRCTFSSTAHPFFLTCNLTQVITMLSGLKDMSEKPAYKGYALHSAQEIWNQLSRYAKERILYVSDNLLHQDTEWYKSLEGNEDKLFRTEYECSNIGDHVLMDCLKNSKRRSCVVEYDFGDKIDFIENVVVKDLSDDGWVVDVHGERMILQNERIIRSTYYKENMF